MERQPRIEYEGAFYHITSRGNLKGKIFFEETDREKFVNILKITKERYAYNLPAYVLMDNHYHLLIETPLPNLTQLMQNINTSYTVFINRKYERSGHLLQGRYKAIVIDKDSYLLTVSRYIHLNPVRAGIVGAPELHRWGSYREYINPFCRSGLVYTGDILSYFSGNSDSPGFFVAEYKSFVESGINDHNNPFNAVKAGVVLGEEDFMERIMEMVRVKPPDNELPALKKLQRGISIDSVIKAVSDYYSLSDADLTERTRRYSEQRKIAIYLSKIMSGGKNSMVAKQFNISSQAVTNVLTEIERMLKESTRLRSEIGNIKCIL